MSVAVSPGQMPCGGVTVTIGSGLILTMMVVVLVQPFAFVPVMVYVVVMVGFATCVAAVVFANPLFGVQLYVVAPLTVNVVLLFMQILVSVIFVVSVGSGFTVTTAVAVLVHPDAVPVTV